MKLEDQEGIKLVKKGSPEEIFGKEAMKKFNKKMEKVNKEYIRKARQSEIDASKVILTE